MADREMKPVLSLDDTSPVDITFERIGQKPFKNKNGNPYYIHNIEVDGESMVWFSWPSEARALKELSVSPGDTVTLERAENDRGKPTTLITDSEGNVADSDDFKQDSDFSGSSGGSKQQYNKPSTKSSSKTTTSQTSKVKPGSNRITNKQMIDRYSECLRMGFAVLASEQIQPALKHFDVDLSKVDRGFFLALAKDIGVSIAISYDRLGYEPEQKAAKPAEEAQPKKTGAKVKPKPEPEPEPEPEEEEEPIPEPPPEEDDLPF